MKIDIISTLKDLIPILPAVLASIPGVGKDIADIATGLIISTYADSPGTLNSEIAKGEGNKSLLEDAIVASAMVFHVPDKNITQMLTIYIQRNPSARDRIVTRIGRFRPGVKNMIDKIVPEQQTIESKESNFSKYVFIGTVVIGVSLLLYSLRK